MVVVSIVLKLVVVQPAPWSWSKSVVVNPAKTQEDAESRSRLDGIVPGLRNIVLEDGGLSGAGWMEGPRELKRKAAAEAEAQKQARNGGDGGQGTNGRQPRTGTIGSPLVHDGPKSDPRAPQECPRDA